MNKIPSGYRFTFTCYNLTHDEEFLIVREGLTEDQACLFSDLAEYLNGGLVLGLDDEPEYLVAGEHRRILAIMEKHLHLFTSEQFNNFKNDFGEILDYISENMTSAKHSDHLPLPMIKNYKAEYIPQDIIINDVTYQLTKKNKI